MEPARVALITGATGAAGRVITGFMAEAGFKLVLTSRNIKSLEQLSSELGFSNDRVLLHAADLTRSDSVRMLLERITGKWEGADILVNVAGGWRGGKNVTDLTEDEWKATLDMNLSSAFLINRAVLPYMIEKKWGRIINFSSKAAETPGQRQAAYNVAKAGVIALTASIAAEYRKKGI
jgi:NAD(P)-dependent dehydrogenase (short-subunit alcohol dehydrogenase family)